MKKFLIFLFALVFPVVFAAWMVCAVTWKIIKSSFLHGKKEYPLVRKEFHES